MYLLVYVDVFEFSAYLRVEAHTQTYQYRFIQSVLWTHNKKHVYLQACFHVETNRVGISVHRYIDI